LNPSIHVKYQCFSFIGKIRRKKNTQDPTLIYSNESCSTTMIFFLHSDTSLCLLFR
jgi:hypothetical protein